MGYPKVTLSVLAALAIIGYTIAVRVSPAAEPIAFELGSLDWTAALNLLAIFFVVSVLLERACEVLVNILTSLGALPAQDAEAPNDAFFTASSVRTLAAILICLLLSGLLVGSGLFLTEMIMDTVLLSDQDFGSDWSFRAADIAITMLILAGGSEGIHLVMKRIKGFQEG